MPRDQRLLRSSEVAAALGVSRTTIFRWVKDGVITPEVTTHGGQARFDLEKVKAQLEASRQTEGPDPEAGPSGRA
ncbi:helix-turn-helix domain-containing protein [Pseudonocardia sp. NPDC049635]|uniref:excisionase family DNA-binding protein n=1 Tax=Pseudonocardia sp. NPDC049635 TaxID=3155506 RepID=UPI0033D39C56